MPFLCCDTLTNVERRGNRLAGEMDLLNKRAPANRAQKTQHDIFNPLSRINQNRTSNHTTPPEDTFGNVMDYFLQNSTHTASLHLPRSLYEYGYPNDDYTSDRDAHQAIYRWSQQKTRNEQEGQVLTVDQLWIWVIDKSKIYFPAAKRLYLQP